MDDNEYGDIQSGLERSLECEFALSFGLRLVRMLKAVALERKQALSPPPHTPTPPPQSPSKEELELRTLLEGAEEMERKYADVEAQLEKTTVLSKDLVGELKAAEEHEGTELGLEDARQTTNDLRARLQESECKLQALERDDRTETLERNLKASQDRATELELQIGKMKQNLANITNGRHEMNKKIDELTTNNERILQEKKELQHELEELKASYTSLYSSHTDSEQARSSLGSELEVSHARQLNEARSLEAEVRARADDAQRAKKDLQAKNSGSNAEKRVRGWEVEVERSKGLLEKRNGAAEGAEVRVRVLEDEMKKRKGKHADELRTLGESMGETQMAHAGLAHELAASKEAIERLEGYVNEMKKATTKERKHEVLRVKEELKNREAEAELLREALETTQAPEQDAVAMVQGSQAGVESLREDERARLRETEGSMASQSPRVPQANFSELLSNPRQQHALDMSTSYSRIRELETEVFDAQASERQLFNSARPYTPGRKVLAPRPVYEENLSAGTRHKRRVSLSMLKARIEIERAAMAAVLHSPALSQIPIEEGEEGASTSKSEHSHAHSHGGFVRRQSDVFDDTHAFWCHSCKGDLVVL
ncbi:hypothetical protein M422DRAFT_241692 [Sphaerobolus stellatus SS14]|nr:hypothetical protein M422DRAFT_241692 [Sphaerobolus stellatus SS14]